MSEFAKAERAAKDLGMAASLAAVHPFAGLGYLAFRGLQLLGRRFRKR